MHSVDIVEGYPHAQAMMMIWQQGGGFRPAAQPSAQRRRPLHCAPSQSHAPSTRAALQGWDSASLHLPSLPADSTPSAFTLHWPSSTLKSILFLASQFVPHAFTIPRYLLMVFLLTTKICLERHCILEKRSGWGGSMHCIEHDRASPAGAARGGAGSELVSGLAAAVEPPGRHSRPDGARQAPCPGRIPPQPSFSPPGAFPPVQLPSQACCPSPQEAAMSDQPTVSGQARHLWEARPGSHCSPLNRLPVLVARG